MKTNRVLLLFATLTFTASNAFAITTLKQVQVSNGSQIDLLFDGKISKGQIKTEFFNDVIQISLSDVSVYPAKISSVSGGNLTKIFAYQYAPKLVRCRLSVKGKADSYKDRLVVSAGGPNGKMLTIRLAGAEGTPVAAEVKSAERAQAKSEDSDEQLLLEKVLKTTSPQQAAPQQAAAHAEKESANTDQIVEKTAAPVHVASSEDRPLNFGHENGKSESHNLTSAKNLPSPLSAFGKLAFVVGLFSILALGVKKFWKGRGQNDNAVIGAIGRFARKNLGTKEKLIEVVANHYLGPKKSIAVVRVGGRTLVVGITEQSINLISQLSSEEDAMNALVEMDNPPLEEVIKSHKVGKTSGTGATVAGPAIFSKILQTESVKPQAGPGTGAQVAHTKMANTTVTQPVAKPASKPITDVRVTSYGNGVNGFTGNGKVPAQQDLISAQAALGLSGVRAQIKSKLEGLKQI